MAVKPVKVLTDLQTNKQITKVDRAAGNAVLFNVSGTVAGGGHVSSSLPYTGSGLFINGDALINGTLTVKTYHSIDVTASVLYESGSSKFGNTLDDTHQFTGSVSINNALSVPYLTASSGLLSSGPSALVGAVTAQNGITVTGAPLDAIAVAVSASSLYVNGGGTFVSNVVAAGLTSSAGASITGQVTATGGISSQTSVYAPLVAGTNGKFVTSSVAAETPFTNLAVITSSQQVGLGSYDVYSIDQAFHAVDTAVSNTFNSYKRLRFQASGTFDPSGVQLVALPTASLGGAAFPITSLDYVTIDVMIKLESGDNWMNDVVAVETYVTGTSGNEYIEIAINSADVPYAYRLIAVNEDPTKYVI
jgi:hypothetical protein